MASSEHIPVLWIPATAMDGGSAEEDMESSPPISAGMTAETMIRFILAAMLILIVPVSQAVETLVLQAGAITAKGWKLEGITIALTDLAANPQKLALLITELQLPKPFNDLSLVDVQCSSFSWQNKELLCQQGKAKVRSKQWLSPETKFSFRIQENRSSFKLTDLQLAGGSFAIDAEELGDQWQIQINGRDVESQRINKLVQLKSYGLKEGKLDFRLNASGSHALIHRFKAGAEIEGLTLQTPSGRFASEKLTLDTRLEANYQDGLWHWQNRTQAKSGALYIDPVYLEAGGQNILLEAQGNWDSANQRAEISTAHYQHAPAADISGNATIQFGKGTLLENANLSLDSKDLEPVSAIYLKPFFTETPLEGITLSGELNADFSISRQSLTSVTASFNKLDINDEAGRIKLLSAAGTINWSENDAFTLPSQLGWQQLKVRALPIGPAQLSFLTKAKSFKLQQKATLPFLGGELAVNEFNWRAKEQDDPDISFSGSLNNASLAQLSKAFNWTPLSGTIGGVIPRVDYRDKTLTLDGKLTINVFDGSVTVSNLASSGLFTDFPKLYTDLEIENLDLEQLTGKFSFGSITGKLSGFVHQLQMENWKPVTFYAWIGTPDDDDSRHRISQKAVKNIASIGGGGASDLLSRSFLSLFETFGYDKLGLGCYLHEGVCQLMGVEPAASGYAIITGGGLPRIDVIGYNPRVDWNVLMERLGRISTSEEVIIK